MVSSAHTGMILGFGTVGEAIAAVEIESCHEDKNTHRSSWFG
jgi:hypothetical protein